MGVSSAGCAKSLLRVAVRLQEMQRNVFLVADDPAVVRLGGNMKERTRPQLDHPAIRERAGRGSRYHETDVLERAQLRPGERRHVHGPFPARLINRPPDRETADFDDLETPLRERPHFIGILEIPQIHFMHTGYLLARRWHRPA